MAGKAATPAAIRSPAFQSSWLLQAPSGSQQCFELTLITYFGVHSCYKQFQQLGSARNNLFHLATNAGNMGVAYNF